ncbi:hypothetical protein ROZALSC1DRAFT_23496 [Rozella allomycis CSF55]|uniref:Exportin-1 C-terminal domain-containing protein n=1 Tax=Rozella allomycis (strain CSF55) TaxID=988480 RepID=A0A4P9YF82_ROZAC|nr:hypothetical protein ROZALSC1DRAFT_23496 [Rozella allomycis CSF55]
MFFWGLLAVVTVISNAFIAASPSGLSETEEKKLDYFVTIKDLETDGVKEMFQIIERNKDMTKKLTWNLYKKVINQVFQCFKVETLRQRATKAFENLILDSSRKSDILYGRDQESRPFMNDILENIKETSKYLDDKSLFLLYKAASSTIRFGIVVGHNNEILNDYFHNNEILNAYWGRLLSVPNNMLEDMLAGKSEMDNVFNNDKNVDLILKVLNMYNGVLQNKGCNWLISKSIFDVFAKFKKFESTNKKLGDMKNELRKLSFSLVLTGNEFKDLHPIVKVIYSDGEDTRFLINFVEWIKNYSQQITKLETISDEEMFKLKIALSIINNYGHQFSFESYYVYAKVLFDVVAKSDIEISDELMRLSFNLHGKIDDRFHKLTNLSTEVVSEVASGLKEFRMAILNFLFRAFDRMSDRFMLGYRNLVLSDIDNNHFDKEIINLFSLLLQKDQYDEYNGLYLYKSALTKLMDENLTNVKFDNESELFLNFIKSLGELSHIHPDLFKIVIDRLIFVLNHESRNVSNAGVLAINRILERCSHYDFSKKVHYPHYRKYYILINAAFFYENQFDSILRQALVFIIGEKLDSDQYSQTLFNLLRFSLKVKSDEASVLNIKEMLTRTLLEIRPSLEESELNDTINRLVNIENDFESFKSHLKQFSGPKEEQSDSDVNENKSRAQANNGGSVKKGKREKREKKIEKGSKIKRKIMAGAAVGIAALSPFLFKNNPSTQDVSAVVAKIPSDNSLVALPQWPPNSNAAPAVTLPHEPMDSSLQTKGGASDEQAKSGVTDATKSVEDPKKNADQGTGVDEKKQDNANTLQNHELNHLKERVDRKICKKPVRKNAFSLVKSTSNLSVLDNYDNSGKMIAEQAKDVEDPKTVSDQGAGVHKKIQYDTTPTSDTVPTDDQIIETSLQKHDLNQLKERVDRIIGKKPSGNNAFCLANSTSNVTILDDYVCSANLLDNYRRSTPEQKLKSWFLTESLMIQGLFSIAEKLGVYLILLYYFVNGFATLDYSSIMKRQNKMDSTITKEIEASPVKVEEASNKNLKGLESINGKDKQNISQYQEPEPPQDNQKDKDQGMIGNNKSIENKKIDLIQDDVEERNNGRNTGIVVGSIAAGLGLLGAASFAYKKHKKDI